MSLLEATTCVLLSMLQDQARKDCDRHNVVTEDMTRLRCRYIIFRIHLSHMYPFN
jgi:hypothetical protein